MKIFRIISTIVKLIIIKFLDYTPIPTPLYTLDRSFLEREIFNYLNNIVSQNNNLLFIGVANYTKHYWKLLDYKVFTIDFDPQKKCFGSSNHNIGSATNLNDFYPSNFFSVIIANGLLGYGMNSQFEFNQMIDQAHNCLCNNGILILGYNENPNHVNFDIKNSYLKKFNQYNPCINEFDRFKFNNHEFVFLKKNG